MSWFRGDADSNHPDANHPDANHPKMAHARSVPPAGDWFGTVPQLPVDAVADRRLLIDLVIYAFDRARTPAVQDRLAAGLAQIGVQVIRPDGTAFDPGSHEAGGVLPTADPSLHNVIAETECAGFRDGERIVREPVVVVYRLVAGR